MKNNENIIILEISSQSSLKEKELFDEFLAKMMNKLHEENIKITISCKLD